MIVRVKKYLIFGIKEQMNLFFRKAQKEGFIEFIQKKYSQAKELPEDVHKILQAIKILKKQPLRVPISETSFLDEETIVERVLHASKLLESLHEEKRILRSEITRVAPFGDFSLSDISYLAKSANRVMQFFTMKTDKAREKKIPEELIYVGTDYELDYFISIQKEKKTFEDLFEMQIDRPLGMLQSRMKIIQKQIAEAEKDLKNSAGYIDLLQKHLTKELNQMHLKKAKNSAQYPFGDALFSVEAWVPKNKQDQMEKLIKDFSVFYEEILVEKSDRRPTYLENHRWSKVGEDLVHVYDTPSIFDKDPSLWVLTFFSIFFAMIVSDAGYGLVFLSIALFLRYKFGHLKGLISRFIKLNLLLATTCIIWGVFTASFFGMEIPIDSPLRKVSVLHFMAEKKAQYHLEKQDDVHFYWLSKYPSLKADSGKEFLQNTKKITESGVEYEALSEFYNNILMEFSILMGIIHIAFGFLRYLRRNWSGIGWIFFIIGGYLFFPSILNATNAIHFFHVLDKPTSFYIGKMMVYSGIGLACFFALLQRGLFSGLAELMNVIQVFGDVLSYLRLYALALAGMIMSSTFNNMGLQMPIVFGVVVIVLGHLVNIVLATMGGVIHGLRLNFLEWYNHSFEGGGKKFDPLKIIQS